MLDATISMRLDKRLIQQHPHLSRAQAKALIVDERVQLNGEPVTKASTPTAGTDVIRVLGDLPKAAPTRAAPDPSVSFDVLYEDDDVLVVNKPAGVVVHPGDKQPLGTLANGLLARYPLIQDVGEDPLRPGIVHRLDKNTSGVLIVAKTQKAFVHLKTQFQERHTRKTYVALVQGVLKRHEGTYNAPIGRSEGDFRRMRQGTRGVRHPREATTSFVVRERFADTTLLTLTPVTGRMHQLRVHLSAAGHPIVGDVVYGWRAAAEQPEPPRILLHAASLRLTLPSSDRPRTFSAPIPDDITTYLQQLTPHSA